MAESVERELPYLSESDAPEGEEGRKWGYRLETERGDLYLAPLSGREIQVVSDCLDVEALADKRGLTPKAYRVNTFLSLDDGHWQRTRHLVTGLFAGSGGVAVPPHPAPSQALPQFEQWLSEQVSAWAESHAPELAAAAAVALENRRLELETQIASGERRLGDLRQELAALEPPRLSSLAPEADGAGGHDSSLER